MQYCRSSPFPTMMDISWLLVNFNTSHKDLGTSSFTLRISLSLLASSYKDKWPWRMIITFQAPETIPPTMRWLIPRFTALSTIALSTLLVMYTPTVEDTPRAPFSGFAWMVLGSRQVITPSPAGYYVRCGMGVPGTAPFRIFAELFWMSFFYPLRSLLWALCILLAQKIVWIPLPLTCWASSSSGVGTGDGLYQSTYLTGLISWYVA